MNGLHLDLKWPMYSAGYFQRILDTAQKLGINTILLEFENKLFIDWLKPAIHPEHWTAADLRKFLRSAREHHLTVIPKVPLMGHLEWALQWPWWAHLQENHDRREICPSHPETPVFVRRLLQTVLELFPDSPMIHLGGDESFSLGSCPKCRASGKSKGELYLQHYLPLIQQVEAAGRRPMVYGDMILAHPEIIEKFSRSCVICDWDYWSGSGTGRNIWGYKGIESADSWAAVPRPYRQYKKYFLAKDKTFRPFPYAGFLQDAGFDVVIFSAAKTCGDNYCAPRTRMHVENTLAAAQHAREHHLMGTLVTSWAVRFNHFETNWPAIAASAWAYQDPDLTYAQISERFAKEFFGADRPKLFDDLDRLSPDLPDLHSFQTDPFPPNIVHSYLRNIYGDPKSPACKTAAEKQSDVLRSFRQGLDQLTKFAPAVRKNKEMFDHWLLAGQILVHHAQTLPTMISLAQGKKVPAAKQAEMKKELHRQTSRLKRLFRKTLRPVSLEMEVGLRFKDRENLL
jgi:hypothetical protein